MRLSPLLSFYIARQFLFWLGIIFLILVGIALLFDIVELTRRAGGREAMTFGRIVSFSLLKMPTLAEKIVPFAALFGGMMAFWRLNRHHELVVARAAGVSAWQFLAPALAVALILGIGKITIFNPVAAAFMQKYEKMELRYIKGSSSQLNLSRTGLWLRQGDPNGQSILHAQKLSSRNMELHQIIVFRFQGQDRFIGRIDAPVARLTSDSWDIRNAWITEPGQPPRFASRFSYPTDLTREKIQDSFASPATMSFWSLPGFIEVLEEAGFSGLRHRLYWQSQLADPLLLCAMVLIAAAFSLRLARRGGMGLSIAGGALVALSLLFVSDLVFALGTSARLPVVLAAWSPAAISLCIGLAMLFHLEDG